MEPRTQEQIDVAIVGCGPTGATLANLLAQAGLSVLVVEREKGIYPMPRAVHFDDEIMRVFQSVGITDALAEQVIVNKGMRFCDYSGNVLLDWPRPQTLTANAWHASYRFHQPTLEACLRSELARYPHAKLREGYLLLKACDLGEHCELTIQQLDSGAVETVSARYLVGCDGARSTVRACMQVEMQALGFSQRWLVLDLLLKRALPELGDHTIQYCDANRPATYCRNPGLRRRWEFALQDHESDAEISSDENVWQLLQRWISPKDASLERKAIYTFKSAVATQWGAGRMMLAGDAAHLTPPFMGQGMCAGIRDAANLGWKLISCCRGTVAQSVLPSYQSERLANVTEYIATAVKLGQLINRMGSKPLKNNSLTMKSLSSQLGPGLGSQNDALRGQLLPQFRFSNGLLIDDIVGYKFCLLGLGNVIGEARQSAVKHLSCDSEPAPLSWLEQAGVKAVLVRPDRYIFATANDRYQCDRMLAEALQYA